MTLKVCVAGTFDAAHLKVKRGGDFVLVSGGSTNPTEYIPFDMAGFSLSAHSEIATWEKEYAFDGVKDDHAWASGGIPAWLQWQFPTAQVANGYRITVHPSQDIINTPAVWQFVGSNDGTTWVTLDTRYGQIFAPGETKSYSVTPATEPYFYYRLNVGAVNGGILVMISEFEIVNGEPLPYVDPKTLPFVMRHLVPAVSDQVAVWPKEMAFDGIAGVEGNAWASNGTIPAWIQADFPGPQYANGYEITAHASSLDAAPNTWNFLGSNDNVNWDTLDTRTGETFTASETKTYSFTQPETPYSFYRWYVSAVNGNSLVLISELLITNNA